MKTIQKNQKIQKIQKLESQHFEVVRKIFWQTSALQKFESEEKKNLFQYKYLDHYLQNTESFNFVAVCDDDIAGYILCATAFTEEMLASMSYLRKFAEQWNEFPAHLHINCAPNSQGQGVGAALLQHLETALAAEGISGVHLLTAPAQRNVNFYRKNGYLFEKQVDGILFLGKSL